jgi:hypothetical protein
MAVIRITYCIFEYNNIADTLTPEGAEIIKWEPKPIADSVSVYYRFKNDDTKVEFLKNIPEIYKEAVISVIN